MTELTEKIALVTDLTAALCVKWRFCKDDACFLTIGHFINQCAVFPDGYDLAFPCLRIDIKL